MEKTVEKGKSVYTNGAKCAFSDGNIAFHGRVRAFGHFSQKGCPAKRTKAYICTKKDCYGKQRNGNRARRGKERNLAELCLDRGSLGKGRCGDGKDEVCGAQDTHAGAGGGLADAGVHTQATGLTPDERYWWRCGGHAAIFCAVPVTGKRGCSLPGNVGCHLPELHPRKGGMV